MEIAAVLHPPHQDPRSGGWITDNFSWRWIFYINDTNGGDPVSHTCDEQDTWKILRYMETERRKTLENPIDIWVSVLTFAVGIGLPAICISG